MSISRDQASVSLRMAEPAEIAGDWILVQGGTRCPVGLRIDRVEQANAHDVADAACVSRMLAADVAGWRPAPDGIELAGADGLTLALFADQGDGTAHAALPGGVATLRRAS